MPSQTLLQARLGGARRCALGCARRGGRRGWWREKARGSRRGNLRECADGGRIGKEADDATRGTRVFPRGSGTWLRVDGAWSASPEMELRGVAGPREMRLQGRL